MAHNSIPTLARLLIHNGNHVYPYRSDSLRHMRMNDVMFSVRNIMQDTFAIMAGSGDP